MEAFLGDVIPISLLKPADGPIRGTIRGVVTIIWPYSASKQSISLLLAERDFRLRRKKGQVRLTFRGHSAKAFNLARIGSGNELILSLDGAVFKPDISQEQTPGRGIEWQLEYSRRVHLAIQREDGQTTTLEVDRSTPTPEPEGTLRATAAEALGSPPPFKANADKDDQVWQSPAFLSSRTHFAQPFLSQIPSDDEEPFEDAKRSKRTKFGRQSGQWRFADRDASPTPAPSVNENAHAIDMPSSGDLESVPPKISPVSVTKTATADLSSFVDSILSPPFPNEATGHFLLLDDGNAVSIDDFALIPESGVFQSQPSQGVSFAVTDTADTEVEVSVQDTLAAEVADDLVDVTAPTIASDFLISPEFQTFPSEIAPVFSEMDSAVAPPIYGNDVTNEDEPGTMFHDTSLEPSETQAQEYEAVTRRGVSQTRFANTTYSDSREAKSGSANKPIEIIDLDSESSGVEASPHVSPIVPKEERRSEDEFTTEDDDQEELRSRSFEAPGADGASMRRRSSLESYESEESDELSETADERYRAPQQLEHTPTRTEQSSIGSSEEDADAEGDDDYDNIQETRRLSVSSSSEDTEASASTTDSAEKHLELSLQASFDDAEEDLRSSDTGKRHAVADASAATIAESTNQQIISDDGHIERFAEDEAMHETSGASGQAQTLLSSAMQPNDSTAKELIADAASPKTRLVTRERLGNQEDIVDDIAPPSIGFNRQVASKSVENTGRLPESQDRSSKYQTTTEPTIAASEVAKRMKEELHPGQDSAICGFRTRLAYFATIASLAQHYNRQVDTIGVVANQTEIEQARKGPKDYFTTLKIADPWAEELGRPKYVSSQILRWKKAALPECKVGDVILLRQFKVQQHKGELHLLSSSESAWAVFAGDEEGKVTVCGPPFELGAEEEQLADGLQQWWAALEHKLIAMEELAGPKAFPKESRMNREGLESMPPASPERHVLRDGSSYTDGPGEAVHRLRDGSTYSD